MEIRRLRGVGRGLGGGQGWSIGEFEEGMEDKRK